VIATGVETVLQVLEDADFERLPKPLIVAGSTFDFDAAVKGTGVSHDLVVVATSTTAPRRLVRLLSGLSRTLDQVESRRPISLVLLGELFDAPTMADLERYARVLTIESDAPAPDQVRRAVAVLMPLTLPTEQSQGKAPLTEVAENLGRTLSSEHQVLIDAARIGPEEVRESLRRYLDAAAQGEPSEGSDS
jgi:hypothetical protein